MLDIIPFLIISVIEKGPSSYRKYHKKKNTESDSSSVKKIIYYQILKISDKEFFSTFRFWWQDQENLPIIFLSLISGSDRFLAFHSGFCAGSVTLK